MKSAEIIESLRGKLGIPGGRHLYGVLGSYKALASFAGKLREARTPDGERFPKPQSVNEGILKAIPDDEFRELAEQEAKMPEPTAAHVKRAFEKFLRARLRGKGLLVLKDLEMLFAYSVDFSLLRALAADDDRILLLLPGKRTGGKVIMYPGWDGGSYALPVNLIAENHLWELND
jgi:hypothetical protein